MKTQLAFSLLLLLSSACCAASTCVKYEDPTVSLKGKVIVRTFFGPPGYGENPKADSKEQQALLVLDHAICVDASRDEEGATNEIEITLVPIGNFGLSTFVGKRVTVKGSLFHANTAHHHTKVLMQLEQPSAVTE